MYKSNLLTFLFLFIAAFSFGQFSGAPANASACEGNNGSFTASYNDADNGGVTFEWIVDGNTLSGASGTVAGISYSISTTFVGTFGAGIHIHQTILTIQSVVTGFDGYLVSAKETASTDVSADAMLTVNTNPIISTPADITTCVGEDAVFTATISGSGTEHDYTWTKSSAGTPTEFGNGEDVPTGGITGTVTGVTSGDDNSGIKLVVTDENGCSVTSGFANTNLGVDDAPSISTQPDATTTFCSGGNAVLTVISNGTTFSWHDGTSEVGTAASYTAASAGTYTVTVGNAGCTAGAGAVVATSSVVSESPTLAITSQPTSPNIAEGETGSTSISYTAGANESVSWFLSGEALSNGSTAASTGVSIVQGSGTSTITLTGVTAGDVGKSLSATITDDCGSVNSAPTVLPVEFMYIKANQLGNAVKLDWATASELNNEAFYIERSVDGANFVEVGMVKGAGTSVEVLEYNFVDNAPATGTNYYRIRQVDFDGSMELSEVVEVKVAKSTFLVNVNPTAASNEVQIVLGTSYEQDLTVQIFDALGRNVMNTAINAGNNVLPVDVSAFQSGTYFIKLYNDSQAITKTFVKL